MRLIDADAIKLPNGFFDKIEKVPMFYEWLKRQPTVSPLKHGKWVREESVYRCSVCDNLWTGWWATIAPVERVYAAMQYCPYCGSKMDGITFHTEDTK